MYKMLYTIEFDINKHIKTERYTYIYARENEAYAIFTRRFATIVRCKYRFARLLNIFLSVNTKARKTIQRIEYNLSRKWCRYKKISSGLKSRMVTYP